MRLGIDRLISQPELRKPLQGKRVALVGHPASVTSDLRHSLDALASCSDIELSSAFGPQHGMRGDKQDNMIESTDFMDSQHHIPVFSLYGDVRKPTDEMLDSFDVLLFDVQDLGCRIYTYITTLLYLLQACGDKQKTIYVLDRPNPAGRTVEGNLLQDGWQSFVGADKILMRHGLTTGEIAKWFVKNNNLDVELVVIEMEGYDPDAAPGYGWPTGELTWVNPSPNASSLNMARCYAGTVLLEGTELSEGRGTTIPLELVGAPDIDADKVLGKLKDLAPQWMQGAYFRSMCFEPTFHKYTGKLCKGIQIHTDTNNYDPKAFVPFRFTIGTLKVIKQLYPDYTLWRDFDYEYELDKLPFDVINGGTLIREWIEDDNATIGDIEKILKRDEQEWSNAIRECLIY